MNGQSCFWFSQGCFIGCANCTGTDIQPDGLGPQTDGPHANCTLSNRPAGATYMPTLPKRLWTMNRAAVELSVNDTYRFHPWRAPGSAPVEDACGIAGGTTRKYAGPGHTTFMPVSTNQSSAVQGSRGSQVLAASAVGATWKIGATAEVKFGIRYNHGGGYQYRLCPADEQLTEDCFQRNALRFVEGSQLLEWKNGTRLTIQNPQYVNEGVIPVGVDWAMNPIPVVTAEREGCESGVSVNATDSQGRACRQFVPPCGQQSRWQRVPGSSEAADVMGECSHNWIDGLIVDTVMVPANLAPGKYVLGWRWDAEQTSQVWSACSDIALVV